MAGAKENVTWRDAKGNTARTTFYVDGTLGAAVQNTNAAAVITALAGLTNCAEQMAIGPHNTVPAPTLYGTNAEFASVEDKAIFTMTDGFGSFHRIQIPAPLASIFLADGETVDLSNTAVVAFSTAVGLYMFSRNGNPLLTPIGGTRIRRKMHRKLSILVKDPDLDGPAE